MLNDVKNLISSATGYIVLSIDDTLLEYIYESEKQHILNDCNLSELPDGLQFVLDEYVAAKFLNMNIKNILGDENLSIVTKIQEGDTTVELSGKTDESRLTSLINTWLAGRERDLACYRKLKW